MDIILDSRVPAHAGLVSFAGNSSKQSSESVEDPLRDTLPMIVVRLASPGDDRALARIDLATWTPAVSPAPTPVDANCHRFFTDTRAPSDVSSLRWTVTLLVG